MRFAVVSLVLVVVLGVAMAQLLASMIAARGLESAKDAAVLTTTIAVQPLLSADDLADGLSRPRSRPWTARCAAPAAAPRSPGSRSGTATATWSTSPTRTRARRPAPGPNPRTSWPRRSKATSRPRSSAAADEPDNAALIERYGTLLEVYVPILYGDDPEPAGVFELYLPYQPVQASIRADTTRAVALLFAGLVVLWLGLFRTVATASRRLRREADRNEHQALHDGLTGLANREPARCASWRPRSAARPRRAALVLLDLDRFKRGQRHPRPRPRRRAAAGDRRRA